MPGNRKNRVRTAPRKISLDSETNRVLEEMAPLGLYGKNPTEVASYVVRTWLRDHREELKDFGVSLVKRLKK